MRFHKLNKTRRALRTTVSSIRRRGLVLLVVLVVVVILALAAYTFSDMMITHQKAARLSGRQVQARSLVSSGVSSLRLFLAQDQQTQLSMGGVFDNPYLFQGSLVVDEADTSMRGRFTVLAPLANDDGYLNGYRYGLEDESARLNLNALLIIDEIQEEGGRNMLMALPGMTIEIADAILDWLDEDDDPREYGFEFDYYSNLDPPYSPRNGPLETVEELLLVVGITPDLLLGSDVNRNGQIDYSESQMFAGGGIDIAEEGTGSLERGWSAYLTINSKESLINSQGESKIDLNSEDLQQLHDDLLGVFDQQQADFIIACRQFGPPIRDPVDGDSSAEEVPEDSIADFQVDLTQESSATIDNPYLMIGSRLEIPSEDGSGGVLLSPFSDDPSLMQEYLPTLFDSVTSISAESIPGRININLAPRSILLAIPGITEEIVDEIIDRRTFGGEGDNLSRLHASWLLSEGIVTLDEIEALNPYINARGDVYRAQIVGYFEGGGVSSRAEVLVDASFVPPRVVMWRDISHLGRGYALETLGVSQPGEMRTQ